MLGLFISQERQVAGGIAPENVAIAVGIEIMTVGELVGRRPTQTAPALPLSAGPPPSIACGRSMDSATAGALAGGTGIAATQSFALLFASRCHRSG